MTAGVLPCDTETSMARHRPPSLALTRWSVALGVLALALGGLACAAPKVDLRGGGRSYTPDDYGAIARRWTREERLNTVAAMDNVLTVTSTFESWDFRWAYATRYARDYGLSTEEAVNLRTRALAETTESHHFVVALFGTATEHGDLTKKEPAWVVRLVDDRGTVTEPVDLVKVKSPSPPMTIYYPFVNSWRTAYRVTFPRVRGDGSPSIGADARWFGLEFTGPQGKATLVWELAEAKASGARE